MEAIISRIIGLFVDKKKIIAWLSAGALVLGSAAAGMQTKEFKDAVCSAPILEIGK